MTILLFDYSGDKSAMVPSGLRMGTPALTTRGFVEQDFDQVAEFVDRAVDIAKKVKSQAGPKVADFKNYIDQNIPDELKKLATDV